MVLVRYCNHSKARHFPGSMGIFWHLVALLRLLWPELGLRRVVHALPQQEA